MIPIGLGLVHAHIYHNMHLFISYLSHITSDRVFIYLVFSTIDLTCFFHHTYLWWFLHSWLAHCFYHFLKKNIFSAFFHTITHTHCLHSFFPFHIPHFFSYSHFLFSFSTSKSHLSSYVPYSCTLIYNFYHPFYTLLYYIPRTYSSCCNRLVFCFLFLLYYIFYYLSIMHFCSQYSYAFYLRQLWPT